jgi:hypothetical protein
VTDLAPNLRGLWDQLPVSERIPPRALAEDRVPWVGGEASKFAEIFDVVREITASPAGELRTCCLAHLDARWRALFESWAPKGPSN